MDYKSIQQSFREKYNNNPVIFRSPGRINLIGEHTDYNDGFVLPAAIDKEIVAAIAPNGSESKCSLYAYDLDKNFEFTLNEMAPVEEGWPNYIMGVADQMIQRGAKLRGFDCVVGGDVPLGAGLSSSAALECVIAYGLNELFECGFNKVELVEIAQLAEHTYAGVMCGIMDQFASMMGKKDAVLKLDCRSLEYEHFPLELGDYQVLLLNTNVKHSLASTEYNARRQECEKGVEIIQRSYPEVQNLRDVSLEMLEELKEGFDPIVFKRCKFVVEENNRVLLSCSALLKGDLTTFGELVYGSHIGLSNEYEVSCPELDFLVELTKDKDFILGARMMGGGFGGCTINIIRKDKVDPFIDEVTPLYKKEFDLDLDVILVSIEAGTSMIP